MTLKHFKTTKVNSGCVTRGFFVFFSRPQCWSGGLRFQHVPLMSVSF